MGIAPNTSIWLLQNVPLDNTYESTIYFDSVSQQTEYFLNSKFSWLKETENSYQRVNNNKLRIRENIDKIYPYNYLAFINKSYENKYFYAFITSINYINDNTTEIEYEIDVLQTWFFQTQLHPCFVEREHSQTDYLFENLVPEKINVGMDYICGNEQMFNLSDMNVAILASKDMNNEVDDPKNVNNYYMPLTHYFSLPIDSENIETTNSIINKYLSSGRDDQIVSIYEYPSWITSSTAYSSMNHAEYTFLMPTQFEGYTPKNKKLFSYPYSFLRVSNNSGQTTNYKWENWTDKANTGKFKIVGTVIPAPEVMIYPIFYSSMGNDYDEGLIIKDFPQCAWTGDVFAKWWAENRGSLATAAISTALAGLGFATGAYYPASATAVTAVSSILSVINASMTAETSPPPVHGQTSSSALSVAINKVGFSFYPMMLRAQEAAIIDDYFTLYGYAVNRIKTPNRKVRPYWTYTKTINCNATATRGEVIPANDLKKIRSIYDKGITFWTYGSEVGNYAQDNRCVRGV